MRRPFGGPCLNVTRSGYSARQIAGLMLGRLNWCSQVGEMTEELMSGKNMDEPDEYERRAIDRHPLTQRLNRELLDCFKRNSGVDRDPPGNQRLKTHKA